MPDEGHADQYHSAKRQVEGAKTAVAQAADRSWAASNARDKLELRAKVANFKISARYSRARADRAIKSVEEFMALGPTIDLALSRAVEAHDRAKMILAKKTAAAFPAASEEAPAAATSATVEGVDKRKRSLDEGANITIFKVMKAKNESGGSAARSGTHGDDAAPDGEGKHVAPAKVDAQRNGLARARRYEGKVASELAEAKLVKSTNAQETAVEQARANVLDNIAIHDARLCKEVEALVKGSTETKAYYAAIRDLRHKRAVLADAEQEVLRLELIFLEAKHAASRGEIGSKRVRDAICDAGKEASERRMEKEADRKPKSAVLPVLKGLDGFTPARAWVEDHRQTKKELRLLEGGRAKGAEGRAESRRSTRQTRGKPAEVFEA